MRLFVLHFFRSNERLFVFMRTVNRSTFLHDLLPGTICTDWNGRGWRSCTTPSGCAAWSSPDLLHVPAWSARNYWDKKMSCCFVCPSDVQNRYWVNQSIVYGVHHYFTKNQLKDGEQVSRSPAPSGADRKHTTFEKCVWLHKAVYCAYCYWKNLKSAFLL